MTSDGRHSHPIVGEGQGWGQINVYKNVLMNVYIHM